MRLSRAAVDAERGDEEVLLQRAALRRRLGRLPLAEREARSFPASLASSLAFPLALTRSLATPLFLASLRLSRSSRSPSLALSRSLARSLPFSLSRSLALLSSLSRVLALPCAPLLAPSRPCALARLCIDITLQQRNNGKIEISEEELMANGNVSTFDVDKSAVGFVLGAKGQTLRQFETQHRTFMFFDNDCLPGTTKKRLYILGTDENRKGALAECENAVEYKMSGKSTQVSSWRDRGGPRYDEGYRRSRSRR